MGKRKKESEAESEVVVKTEADIKPFEEMFWSKLLVNRAELNLQFVLKCGQSFRWSQHKSNPPEWIGVLHGKLFILSQTDDELLYKVLPESDEASNI
jgi:hypothetical protein